MMYRYLLMLVLELCTIQYASGIGSYKIGTDGLYYKFHDKLVNWDTANATCTSEGAHLAVVNSSTTFEFIKNTYNQYMLGMWLGARDEHSNNNWKWINGKPLKDTLTYWENGEPNNYQGVDEDCMMTNYLRNPGHWHDAPCSWAGPKFLCQKSRRVTTFVICENATSQRMSCPHEERIHIIHAMYGRKSTGICAHGAQSITICGNSSSLEKAKEMCDGKSECLLRADNSMFGNPCVGVGKYLEVKYICYHPETAVPTSGSTGCGSYTCQQNKAQIGYDIAHSKENSLEKCSRKCCENQLCKGFDWVSYNDDCYLSKTPQSQVVPVHVSGVHSCEFKDVTQANRNVVPTDLRAYVRGTDGLYYKFHNKQVDWFKAKATCESEGDHLAVVDSSATFEYIQRSYNQYMQGVWLGARDVNSNNNWKWINGKSVKKTYWNSGEPNNYRGVQEDCMMTNYYGNPGRFHDAPCSWNGPKFLCQKGSVDACKAYTCKWNMAQMGYDIAHSKEKSLDKCSKKCCENSRCKGFDWVTYTDDCYLTKTLQSQVPPVYSSHVYSCEFIEVPAGYSKGSDGMYYKFFSDSVNWNDAKSRCSKDGAQLAIDDSDAVHQYLLSVYRPQVYWIGANELEREGIWKYNDGRKLVKSYWDKGQPGNDGKDEHCVTMWYTGRWRDDACYETRPFLCQIKGVMPTKHKKKKDAGDIVVPLVIFAFVCFVLFLIVRIHIYHKHRKTRDSTIPATQMENVRPAAVIANEPSHVMDDTSAIDHPEGKSANISSLGMMPGPPMYQDLFPDGGVPMFDNHGYMHGFPNDIVPPMMLW